MSGWFYIGRKENNESRMTYYVVHEFTQMREVGNPLAGQPIQHISVPATVEDMQTKNRDEARARVNFLNGGDGVPCMAPTDSDADEFDA
jgi:hypothetical protein